MALYTKDSIDRLKDAVDMVELVGARTDLRRVGSRFTGLCPFHDERTPSFSVNADERLYYCFGCGEGGDAFKFVGPVAKSAGIRLEEVTAAIQLLSNAGIQGEMAGTTLRGWLAASPRDAREVIEHPIVRSPGRGGSRPGSSESRWPAAAGWSSRR